MYCSTCGMEIPYGGHICSYCGANKVADKTQNDRRTRTCFLDAHSSANDGLPGWICWYDQVIGFLVDKDALSNIGFPTGRGRRVCLRHLLGENSLNSSLSSQLTSSTIALELRPTPILNDLHE